MEEESGKSSSIETSDKKLDRGEEGKWGRVWAIVLTMRDRPHLSRTAVWLWQHGGDSIDHGKYSFREGKNGWEWKRDCSRLKWSRNACKRVSSSHYQLLTVCIVLQKDIKWSLKVNIESREGFVKKNFNLITNIHLFYLRDTCKEKTKWPNIFPFTQSYIK